MRQSTGELAFALQITANELNGWHAEYRFCDRRWRFDFAHPEYKIAVEIEGGTWTSGRHNRGAGIAEDMKKYNRAAIEGWRVLRFTTAEAVSGYAIGEVMKVLTRLPG